MADIAQLGFSVDSSGLRRATGDLNALRAASERATRATSDLTNNNNKLSGALSLLQNAALLAAGALVAHEWVDATNNLIEYNAELNLLNKQLLVSRDNLQIWGQVGKQAGVDIADQLKDISEKIAEFATTGGGEAADFFKRAGLSPAQIKEIASLDPAGQILKVGEALEKIKGITQGEKIFLLEGLADDASKLLPYLDNSAAKLREIERISRESGVILDERQNRILSDAYTNLSNIKLALTGASNAAGTVGAELLNAFSGGVIDSVSRLDDLIYQVADDVKLIARSWDYALSQSAASTDDFSGEMQTAWDELTNYLRVGWTYFPVWAQAAYTAAHEYGLSFGYKFKALDYQMGVAWQTLMAVIVESAGGAFATVADVTGDATAAIIGRLADAAEAMGTFSDSAAATAVNLRAMQQVAATAGERTQAAVTQSAQNWRDGAQASANAAKLMEAQGQAAAVNAQYALANAAAFQQQSEKQREVSTAIRESSAAMKSHKSTLDDASKAAGEIYFNEAEVKKALEDTESAAKAATEAVHEHGDAMQQAAEAMTQRTLLVKAGTLAEQYYIERMKGVTDAEARRIVSGNQYLTYLQEQQNLTKDATAAHGGLLDAYRQKLDDAGLGSANDAFDAAKSSTDKAVDAAKTYREAIEAVTKSAQDAASAVSSIGSAQPTAYGSSDVSAGTGVNVKSGGGKRSQALSETIAAAAAKHPQVIAVIDKVAKDTGTDPAIMKTMAYIESRFNDKAYNKSSASGVYQFVNSTAKQYGLSGKQFDAESNARAYTKLLSDNAAALKRYGIEVTGANLYLAHQQGAGGLKQIMDEAAGGKSMSATVRRNMRANPSGGDDSTAAGFLKGWTEKYNSIEASVNAAIKPTAALAVQSSAVAEQTTKAADATAKAPPIWEELNQKADETKKITVEYGGEIEGKVVTAQMRASLEQRYMNGEAQKLIDTANGQAQAIGKTGYVIRQNELDQLQFNAAQQAAILNAESALAYAQEESALSKEMAAIQQPGLASQYAAGLSDKNLSQDQIQRLTTQKLDVQNAANMAELDDRAAKATLTADAYKRMTLERDGFTKAQVDGQLQWEAEVESLEHARELADGLSDTLQNSVTSSMQDMLKTGNDVLDQLIAKMIESIMTSQEMSNIFSSFGSNYSSAITTGITSFFGFENGGHFTASSAIRAYANGDSFHNSVLASPVLFKANGKQAVAGEAGAEAVMPMPNGGVLAQFGGDVLDLPLTRIAGKLAVNLDQANLSPLTPFASGAFSATSAIRAYAAGDAFHNSVLTSPVLFSTPDSRQAVAGEAGAEAIMPMPNGGVLAQTNSGVIDLPLTRVGGKLAVDLSAVTPFADGGSFGGSSSGGVNTSYDSGGNINIDMPINIDARGATSDILPVLSKQLQQLEQNIYANVPRIVRQSQINARSRPVL